MDKDYGREQAILQVNGIVQMVAALNVDYDHMDTLWHELEEVHGGAVTSLDFMAWCQDQLDSNQSTFEETIKEFLELREAAGDCESQDEAQQQVQEDPLCIDVREPWHSIGEEGVTPDQFRIVLCTGGPHVEIQGDLDDHMQPDRVRIIYKDWGSNGELFDFDRDAVLRYCQQFYFGE